MLFKKNHEVFKKRDNISASNEAPKIVESQSAPICILGDNTLAYYLAGKFSSIGEKVVIVSNNFVSSNKVFNNISLKEDYNLQKNRCSFTTSFWIKDAPKLLVITSSINNFKASITTLSPSKLKATPILCLTPLKEISYLQAFLDKEIILGYFDGYLGQKDTDIILYGKAPNLKICLNAKHHDEIDFIADTFKKIQIDSSTETNKDICFWDFFAGYVITTLLTTAYNKSIFDITKDRQKRETLRNLATELSLLAKSENVNIDTEELLRKIYNIPSSFSSSLRGDILKNKTGELNYICTVLLNISQKNQCSIPTLTNLIREIHNIIIV